MASMNPEEDKAENKWKKSNISSIEEHIHDSQEESDTLQVADGQREKLIQLPLGRVRNIVKIDPEVNLVNQEAIFLITKSTVSF